GGTARRRSLREAAMVAHRGPPRAVERQADAAVRAGLDVAARFALQEALEAAAVQDEQRLLAGREVREDGVRELRREHRGDERVPPVLEIGGVAARARGAEVDQLDG